MTEKEFNPSSNSDNGASVTAPYVVTQAESAERNKQYWEQPGGSFFQNGQPLPERE